MPVVLDRGDPTVAANLMSFAKNKVKVLVVVL
jgi:hypothetical protein